MRYKVLGIVMAVVMCACALAATAAEQSGGTNRYHQHLSAAVPAEPCSCDGSELCTHLPILRIETGGQYIPGEMIPTTGTTGTTTNLEGDLRFTTAADGSEDILVTIETVEGEGVWNHASDEADHTSLARFRIRGNSSRQFPKKNYRIKLVADEAGLENEELPLLGMSPDNDWALHGPFLDKTLLRNYMWMNLSAEIMGYAPNVRFCEVLLDGEYQGVSLLMETIKEDEYRVDLSDYEPGASETSYLLAMNGTQADGNQADGVYLENYTRYTYQMEFDAASQTVFYVQYPQAEYLTEEVIDYIQRDISRVERGLYSADMVTGRYDYAAELDVDSFVDYYILQEFLAVNDAFSRSTYLYRDVRGKLHVGPVWDYNNVLNNFFHAFSRTGFLLENRSWYGRLMTSEDFVERVISRYRQLRRTILSDEYLDGYIDDVVDYLGDAIDRNDEVWGWSYDPNLLEPGQRREPDADETLEEANPSSYEDAIGKMKGYMFSRAEWLDEHIEDLRQYCHRSKNAPQWLE